jgi:hypothetical protein
MDLWMKMPKRKKVVTTVTEKEVPFYDGHNQQLSAVRFTTSRNSSYPDRGDFYIELRTVPVKEVESGGASVYLDREQLTAIRNKITEVLDS